MNNITNEDFEINHLIKQVTWPQPSRDLAFRIQNAVGDKYVMSFDNAHIQVSTGRPPAITFMAVVLAMFLGLASGIMAGGQASATDYDSHPYGGTSSVSVMNVYSGQ